MSHSHVSIKKFIFPPNMEEGNDNGIGNGNDESRLLALATLKTAGRVPDRLTADYPTPLNPPGPGDASANVPRPATQMQRKRRAEMDLTYCEYNLSTMRDTRGGFIVDEQPQIQPSQQQQQQDQQAEAGGMSKRTKADDGIALDPTDGNNKCVECLSVDLDTSYWRYFKVLVCRSCKEKFKEKYSLLTKTECKEDYLLTESEMRDTTVLPFWEKPNPHKSTYANMMLYLRMHVEAFALQKWGSHEAMDAEFERRESEKKDRKDKKYKKKLIELRKKTRTSTWMHKPAREHTHEYGETKHDKEGK
ncbi:hydrophilic protein [Zopfochytrium polystomum]|nr:hydrophilic protein [Zopfochytrium polystomum]